MKEKKNQNYFVGKQRSIPPTRGRKNSTYQTVCRKCREIRGKLAARGLPR